jgi:hypothetical protein
VHSAWRSFATIPQGDGWDEGALSVTVVSPLRDRELLIDTNGEEITVGFGEHGWHAHYWAWDGLDDATVFDRALTEIVAILDEELAILTRFGRGDVRSCETFRRGEEVDFRASERIEIVAWLGSRDATVFPA